MSPLVARPLPPTVGLREERRTVASAAATRRHASLEPALVFCVAYVLYAAVGIALLVHGELVVGDAQSRLAHAYFAWWNEPAKLTAIGFYWPPLQTLVLLPLALVPPLATSLVALPLTSALFGAALLVVLERALRWAGVDRLPRLAIVAAFGLNPLYAFSAVNGMAEIVYLAFLTAGAWVFLRWTTSPRWSDPVLAGTALALGTLARYEVALYAIPMAVAALVIIRRSREAARAAESTLLGLLVPLLYALLLWAYINATIVGDPLGFLEPGAPAESRPDPAFGGWLGPLLDVLGTSASIFPLTFVLAAVLVAAAVRRRDAVAAALVAVLLLNVLTTYALLVSARQGFLLELRYNMRSLPLTVLAGAWLLVRARPARRQLAASCLAVALLLTIPLSGWTMLRHDRELGERIGTDVVRVRPVSRSADFVRMLLRRPAPAAGSANAVDLASERAMASYIRRRIRGENAILTDDSRTFGVMLADGDPGRYLDRIDFGEERWLEAVRDPVGRVGWILLIDRTYDLDRVVVEYPGILSGEAPSFLRLVRREGAYRLYRVVGR